MIRVGQHKGSFIVKYCFSLLESDPVLLGVQRRLAGIPFKRQLIHTYNSNTSYCDHGKVYFWLMTLSSATAERGAVAAWWSAEAGHGRRTSPRPDETGPS